MRIPRVRLFPLIAALALTVAAAVALVLSNRAGLLEGLVFVVAVLLGSAALGAIRWSALLPADVRPSAGHLALLALLRPARLRETWAMAQAETRVEHEEARS